MEDTQEKKGTETKGATDETANELKAKDNGTRPASRKDILELQQKINNFEKSMKEAQIQLAQLNSKKSRLKKRADALVKRRKARREGLQPLYADLLFSRLHGARQALAMFGACDKVFEVIEKQNFSNKYEPIDCSVRIPREQFGFGEILDGIGKDMEYFGEILKDGTGIGILVPSYREFEANVKIIDWKRFRREYDFLNFPEKDEFLVDCKKEIFDKIEEKKNEYGVNIGELHRMIANKGVLEKVIKNIKDQKAKVTREQLARIVLN